MVVLVLVWYDLCVVDNVSYVVGIVVYNNDVPIGLIYQNKCNKESTW